MKGVKISNFIVPMSVTDTYPTNLDIFGKGGIHSVDTILSRNAITVERRSEGMLSFTQSDESMYALLGGVTNDNWIKFFEYKDNKLLLGLDNLPILGAASVTIPTVGAVPIPNPSFNPLSLDWFFSTPWLPQTFAGDPSTTNPYDTKTIISNDLASAQINITKILKRIDTAGFIVKSKTISFNWDNPLVNALPQTVKDIIGLDNSYTFDKAQALDELQGKSLLMVDNTLADKGNISSATLSNGRFWLGENVGGVDNVPTETQNLPLYNLTNLASGKVWQGDINNRPVETQVAPFDATYIIQTPNALLPNAQALSALSSGLLKTTLLGNGVVSIASAGTTPIVNDYVDPISLQTQLAEMTAVITGEIATTFWTNVGISGFLSGVSGLLGGTISAAYGEYMFNNKYKPLQSENGAYDTDNLSKWGKGNIWFDNNRTLTKAEMRPGIRVISWDSSIAFDSDLLPASIGVFGYKWSVFNRSHGQEGFVWQADMENNSSNTNYRCPNKLSLRHVGHSQLGVGWDTKDVELMNYDYYEDEFNFNKDANFLSKGAIKIPVGNSAERPSNSSVGMIRFNTDL